MIGLVLVTHGRLADEFKAALEHVMGPQKQIEAVTIGAEDDSDLCRSDIIEAVNRVDSGDGVAILTDMFGGTPSNLAISCMSRPKVEVLAGINLPMLVKLAKVREERSLPDAIAAVDAVDGFNDVISAQIRVVLGSDRDSFDLLLRAHHMFERRLELVGKAPMGHKYQTNHRKLLAGAFWCTARTRATLTIQSPRARGDLREFNRLGKSQCRSIRSR